MLWMPPWPPTRPTAQSVWPRGRARPTAARAAQGATKQLLTMTGPESSTHGIALADFPGCCCGPTQLPIRHGRCVFFGEGCSYLLAGAASSAVRSFSYSFARPDRPIVCLFKKVRRAGGELLFVEVR